VDKNKYGTVDAALLFAKKRQSMGQPLPYPWEIVSFPKNPR
jgi:hypothetical protein